MPRPACRQRLLLAPLMAMALASAAGQQPAWAADDPFAKRYDSEFAMALLHAGRCTIALRQSSFTYATPYDCRTILSEYLGREMDAIPPEAVLARKLIAVLARDPTGLLACYDEASQEEEARDFAVYLREQSQFIDPEHSSAAIIGGVSIADRLLIEYRIQDRTGAELFHWFEVLTPHGRGWRIASQSSHDGFPFAFSSACIAARRAHGALAEAELAHMSLFRIVATPTVQPQLIQLGDLHLGDMALAVAFTAQDPPLPLDGDLAALSDDGLRALAHASHLHDGGVSDAEIARLWVNANPAALPAWPFIAMDDLAPLRFCHGALRGDACSIYLLGDGRAARSDVMLGAAEDGWKLLNRAPRNPDDCGLAKLSGPHHLWAHLAELLRQRGE